ncbi:MAG TPA: peptide ABC transporter substrate-binding protein [Ktedonobacterales bacterium]
MALRAFHSRIVRLVIVLGALALLLSGCDLPWQAKPSDMAKDQTLRMVWSGAAIYPDPARAYDIATTQAINLLFDGLVTLDRNQHIEPWGAESWTISPDGLAYTFKLRPNQRFSDGTPVEPFDYAWSLDRVANPCTQSALAYYLAAIKDAAMFSGETCNDGHLQGAITTLIGDSLVPHDKDNTLTIMLERPAGYFLATLANPPFFATERSVVTMSGLTQTDYWTTHMSDGKTGQGGSGMFYLAGWTPETMTLKPNPHWWGRQAGKAPHFSRIILSTINSSAAVFSQFATDVSLAFADNIVDLQPNFPLTFTKKQPYYHEQPELIMTSLLLNWKTPPFDDLNARKAFCLAINRDQINEQVFQGGNMPTWHLLPQGLPDYDNHPRGLDDAPVTGNMALAQSYWQRYLAAHPANSAPTSIPILFNDASIRQKLIVTNLQASVSQLFGHPVTLTLFWVPHILGASPGWEYTVPLSLLSWGQDYSDPQDFLSLLNVTGSPDNTQNASVPAADALMRRADTLSDLAQRIPLYQQAEQLLIDNVAACPLYQTINHYALRPWVKGDFVEDARGLFPNDAWITGYIAKH